MTERRREIGRQGGCRIQRELRAPQKNEWRSAYLHVGVGLMKRLSKTSRKSDSRRACSCGSSSCFDGDGGEKGEPFGRCK